MLLNQNIIKVGIGFGLGWISKTLFTEVKHRETETVDAPKAIKKAKETYDAIIEHPERIPDAIDKAHKEIVEPNIK